MIQIEITESIQNTLLHTFKYNQCEVLLGNTKKYDLYIPNKNQLFCKLVIDRDLLVASSNEPLIINRKKINGDKPVSMGDTIQLGSTTFKVIAFKHTDYSKESILRDSYEKVQNDRPDLSVLMDSIENEILKIQIKENNQ